MQVLILEVSAFLTIFCTSVQRVLAAACIASVMWGCSSSDDSSGSSEIENWGFWVYAARHFGQDTPANDIVLGLDFDDFRLGASWPIDGGIESSQEECRQDPTPARVEKPPPPCQGIEPRTAHDYFEILPTIDSADLARGRKIFAKARWDDYAYRVDAGPDDVFWYSEDASDGDVQWFVSIYWPPHSSYNVFTPVDTEHPLAREMVAYLNGLFDKYWTGDRERLNWTKDGSASQNVSPDGGRDAGAGENHDAAVESP